MAKKGELTRKQAKFIDEYLIDMNASAAAERAGYSKKTAYSIGFNLLKNVEIQKGLTLRRQELSAATGITPEKVIQGFADLAFADLADCYDDKGFLKSIHDIPKSARMAMAGIEVFEVFGGTGEDRAQIGQTKKVRMWDKHKGLESLAKHFGLYNADDSQKSGAVVIIRDCVAEKECS